MTANPDKAAWATPDEDEDDDKDEDEEDEGSQIARPLTSFATLLASPDRTVLTWWPLRNSALSERARGKSICSLTGSALSAER